MVFYLKGEKLIMVKESFWEKIKDWWNRPNPLKLKDLKDIEKINANVKDESKTRAEQILANFENSMKKLIADQKQSRKKIDEIFKEFRKQINAVLKERDNQYKIKSQMLLIWDYFKREVEIQTLENKIKAGVLPSERELIMKQITYLNSINLSTEKGFKKRDISPERISELEKSLGLTEGDWKKEDSIVNNKK